VTIEPELRQIHDAAEKGDLQRLSDLLSANPSLINTTDDMGCCPLRYAAMNGHERAVELLLKLGANVNTQDDVAGWTALHSAASEGYAETVKILLEHDAEVNVVTVDEHHWTPTQLAAIQGHVLAVKLLLEHGADISVLDAEGCSLLQNAFSEAQAYRNEGDLENAGRLLKVMEILAISDADNAVYHIEAALEIIARYDNTGDMYQRGTLQEYDQALKHLNQGRELKRKLGQDFDKHLDELHGHIGMGYDLKSKKAAGK